MEKDLLKIIEHFDINNQQRKLQEEVFELSEAIINYENAKIVFGKRSTLGTQHIAEEIADVEVMLLQFKEYYHIDGNEILEIMNNKIKRTLERIESGYYE